MTRHARLPRPPRRASVALAATSGVSTTACPDATWPRSSSSPVRRTKGTRERRVRLVVRFARDTLHRLLVVSEVKGRTLEPQAAAKLERPGSRPFRG
jgi:hypothetical protein